MQFDIDFRVNFRPSRRELDELSVDRMATWGNPTEWLLLNEAERFGTVRCTGDLVAAIPQHTFGKPPNRFFIVHDEDTWGRLGDWHGLLVVIGRLLVEKPRVTPQTTPPVPSDILANDRFVIHNRVFAAGEGDRNP